jgi:hypothetical protein
VIVTSGAVVDRSVALTRFPFLKATDPVLPLIGAAIVA